MITSDDRNPDPHGDDDTDSAAPAAETPVREAEPRGAAAGSPTPSPGAASPTANPGDASLARNPGGASAARNPGGASAAPNPGDLSAAPSPEGASLARNPGGSSAVPSPGGASAAPNPGDLSAAPSPEDASLAPSPEVASAGESSDEPDIGFSLGDGPVTSETAVSDPETRARELAHGIARELAASAPDGWHELTVVFAVTVVVGGGEVVFTDDQERVLRAEPPESVLELVREHRDLSATFEGGPWWRLLLRLDREGHLDVDYDYGDEPFPGDQLLAPEAYLADLQAYPRDRVPVWLAAYIGHGNRQSRPPVDAARQARADRAAGVFALLSDNDFPDLSILWARWSVMAAAFVAAGSQWGPRVLPSLGWFEGSRRGGSTLYVLPGGRAVLSGGVWEAPELDAAYNGGESLPRLYAGAPEWVSNSVLNPRFADGLLSFCYWWEDGRWYRGESPPADRLSDALPGVWTAATVAQVISGLIGAEADESSAAVDTLVAAAEAHVVTRETLAAVCGDDGSFDIDGAFNQLSLAGTAGALRVG